MNEYPKKHSFTLKEAIEVVKFSFDLWVSEGNNKPFNGNFMRTHKGIPSRVYNQARKKGSKLNEIVGSFDGLIQKAIEKYPEIQFEKRIYDIVSLSEAKKIVRKLYEKSKRLGKEFNSAFVLDKEHGCPKLYEQARHEGNSLCKAINKEFDKKEGMMIPIKHKSTPFDKLVMLVQLEDSNIEYSKHTNISYNLTEAKKEVLKAFLKTNEDELFNPAFMRSKKGNPKVYRQAVNKECSLHNEIKKAYEKLLKNGKNIKIISDHFHMLVILSKEDFPEIKYEGRKKTSFNKLEAIEEIIRLYFLSKVLGEKFDFTFIMNKKNGNPRVYDQAIRKKCLLNREVGSFNNLLLEAFFSLKKENVQIDFLNNIRDYLIGNLNDNINLQSPGITKALIYELEKNKLIPVGDTFNISTKELAVNSKNPTYFIRINNTVYILNQYLCGKVTQTNARKRIFDKYYFLKVYSKGSTRAKLESNLSKYINLCYPKLIISEYHYLGELENFYIECIGGKANQFVIALLVEGATLNEQLMKSTKKEKMRLLKLAISQLARFHQIITKDLTFLEKNNVKFENKFSLCNCPIYRGLIHGDAHLDNFWIKDDSVFLLDFEYVGFGPVLFDFIYLLNTNRLTESDKFNLMKYYWEIRNIKFTKKELGNQILCIEELFVKKSMIKFKYYNGVFDHFYFMAKDSVASHGKNCFKLGLLKSKKALEIMYKVVIELSCVRDDKYIPLMRRRLADMDNDWELLSTMFNGYKCSYLDKLGKRYFFNSRPERSIALTLYYIIPDFSLKANVNVKRNVEDGYIVIDFLFKYNNNSYAVEYHPPIWERLKYKNCTKTDNQLIEDYTQQRASTINPINLIVIHEFPLTSTILYKKIKNIFLPEITEDRFIEAWTKGQKDIDKFEEACIVEQQEYNNTSMNNLFSISNLYKYGYTFS